MNLSKSFEFFDPTGVQRIHIIGCGSVGSTLAENLVRCGIKKLTLWDFDTVESKNCNNQIYRAIDIGRPKTEALYDILKEINPEISEGDIILKNNGWNGEPLSGYVFMAVDDIELRKKIVETNMYNLNIQVVFDFRTSLETAQHYAADWKNQKQKENLIKSMDFSHDEAKSATELSACGETLGVVTTVRLICAFGVNNFINFYKTKSLKPVLVVDGFNFGIMAI